MINYYFAIYLAPHTSGPRDVPRCGALSLLQKAPHYRGVGESAATLNAKLCDLVTGGGGGGGGGD